MSGGHSWLIVRLSLVFAVICSRLNATRTEKARRFAHVRVLLKGSTQVVWMGGGGGGGLCGFSELLVADGAGDLSGDGDGADAPRTTLEGDLGLAWWWEHLLWRPTLGLPWF